MRDEDDYVRFLDAGYKNRRRISIYIDHDDEPLMHWIEEEIAEDGLYNDSDPCFDYVDSAMLDDISVDHEADDEGLLEVIKERAPTCEHRQCARHIYANFKKKYTCVEFRKLLWRAKSTTEYYMREINTMSTHAYDHLMERDPKTWCKAFFELDRYWDVTLSGPRIYEVKQLHGVYAIDLDQRTCGCRVWQLTDIPCVHGIAAILFFNGNAEEYVAVWFTTNMFGSCYRYNMEPTNGGNMWPETCIQSILPPCPGDQK
ncbi:unnamed protein product [Lactuca saligna]|uniref:SWIM-type domain-containing protein n=1 Tax=Lactuca saligna TaxID=75948 RepID=A0AA35YEL1_LACSI|nr:unnamed protein product [Lactuca saligna]